MNHRRLSQSLTKHDVFGHSRRNKISGPPATRIPRH